jgi:predicted RNase H-like HicB family nuclease
MNAKVKYYRAIVHKEADSAFGVHFPDLPGCFSAADMAEDVHVNATEALALWFEGQDPSIQALPSFPPGSGFNP